MSNTPVKNGAILFIEPYNAYVRADAYEITLDDIIVATYFRITEVSRMTMWASEVNYHVFNFDSVFFDHDGRYSTMICGPDHVLKL